MPVEIDIDEKSVTAYISGEIDHHNAAGLRSKIDEAVENAYPEVLVLDFGGINYISSAGLRVLLGAQKKMNAQGSMELINVNDDVMDILEMTGFADILVIK